MGNLLKVSTKPLSCLIEIPGANCKKDNDEQFQYTIEGAAVIRKDRNRHRTHPVTKSVLTTEKDIGIIRISKRDAIYDMALPGGSGMSGRSVR